jgi:hypothetical protein
MRWSPFFSFVFFFTFLNTLLNRNGRAKMFSDYGSEVINRKHEEMFNSFYYSSIAWTAIKITILGNKLIV